MTKVIEKREKVGQVDSKRQKVLLEIVKGIMSGKKNGIFFVLEQTEISKGTKFEGACLVRNVSRSMVIQNIIKSFHLDPIEVLAGSLTNNHNDRD